MVRDRDESASPADSAAADDLMPWELGAALRNAARRGACDRVEDLLPHARQADVVDAADSNGFSALQWAAWEGHADVAEVLLAKGQADPNTFDSDRQTPLFNAAWHGYADVVQCLLAHGAASDRPDADGETPLAAAAANGRTDIVSALCAAGADPFPKDSQGRTARVRALESGDAAAAGMLACHERHCAELQQRGKVVARDALQRRPALNLAGNWMTASIASLRATVSSFWGVPPEAVAFGDSAGRYNEQPHDLWPCSAAGVVVAGEVWIWPSAVAAGGAAVPRCATPRAAALPPRAPAPQGALSPFPAAELARMPLLPPGEAPHAQQQQRVPPALPPQSRELSPRRAPPAAPHADAEESPPPTPPARIPGQGAQEAPPPQQQGRLLPMPAPSSSVSGGTGQAPAPPKAPGGQVLPVPPPNSRVVGGCAPPAAPRGPDRRPAEWRPAAGGAARQQPGTAPRRPSRCGSAAAQIDPESAAAARMAELCCLDADGESSEEERAGEPQLPQPRSHQELLSRVRELRKQQQQQRRRGSAARSSPAQPSPRCAAPTGSPAPAAPAAPAACPVQVLSPGCDLGPEAPPAPRNSTASVPVLQVEPPPPPPPPAPRSCPGAAPAVLTPPPGQAAAPEGRGAEAAQRHSSPGVLSLGELEAEAARHGLPTRPAEEVDVADGALQQPVAAPPPVLLPLPQPQQQQGQQRLSLPRQPPAVGLPVLELPQGAPPPPQPATPQQQQQQPQTGEALAPPTALHRAAQMGEVNVLELLAHGQGGAPVPEPRDMQGRTPLMWAAIGGQVRAVEWLCSKGATPAARDQSGADAAMHAVQNGRNDVLRMLTERFGADAHTRDAEGHSLLQWASYRGFLSIAKYLVECHGADLDETDARVRTALHWACRNGRGEVAAYLRTRGASAARRDRDGRTAADLARERGHHGLAQLVEADFGPPQLYRPTSVAPSSIGPDSAARRL